VFGTLIGPYPSAEGSTGDDRDDATVAAVGELAAIGLEPVSDGRAAREVGDNASSVVADWRAAAVTTEVAVKQALIGPFTLAEGSGGDPLAHAEAVGAVAAGLAEAGCPLVEIEEPEAVSAARDDATAARLEDALRRLTDVVGDRVHLSLVLTGGNVDALGASRLFDLPFASYAFDLIAGPDNWRLIAEAPGDRGIICGALDPAASSTDRPETLVWAAHYAASTGGRGIARVGLANASSLAGLTRERARAKLVALVEAARLAALQDPKELAASLDPLAVDIRSAAVGRYDPKPPRRR
jgi:methionine synthase II (cobalamin-independent)